MCTNMHQIPTLEPKLTQTAAPYVIPTSAANLTCNMTPFCSQLEMNCEKHGHQTHDGEGFTQCFPPLSPSA